MQDAKNRKIAFIQACWHRDIVDGGRESFLARMSELGVSPELQVQRLELEPPLSFEP
jgi:6,7-dimethyl-8-ribityllumazine synthase